jgi:hypothetical protein
VILLINFLKKKHMKNSVLFEALAIGLLMLSYPVRSQQYIADHSVAREEVLRSIPAEFINKARTELVIAYQHTSHGTHVSRGVAGLQDYKTGDEVLFGVSASPDAEKLEFRDYALEDYAPSGVTAIDLSVDETAFIQTTRNYLDAPENATVNVIMWSWCDISGHAVDDNYLPGMASLISEYGPGGSMIGTGPGQRELPVSFIYMTGHANKDDNTGSRNPKEQAALITDYCNANSQFCLDYYSIDTHAMDGAYYEDTGDNGDSDTYGGNFYEDWQNAHTLGVDYFENKRVPGGEVVYGEHNSQHITANRKAYAMWWILARIAGWNVDISTGVSESAHQDLNIYPNPSGGEVFIEAPGRQVREIKVINSVGKVLKVYNPSGLNASLIQMDLSDIQPGFYFVTLTDTEESSVQRLIITR